MWLYIFLGVFLLVVITSAVTADRARRRRVAAAQELPLKAREVNRLKLINYVAQGKNQGKPASSVKKALVMAPEVFNDTLEYLSGSGLVTEKPHFFWPDAWWWPWDTRTLSLTAQGRDEVDYGKSNPQEKTDNLAPQVLVMRDVTITNVKGRNNTVGGTGITQGGSKNGQRAHSLPTESAQDRSDDPIAVACDFVTRFRAVLAVEEVPAPARRRAEAQLQIIDDELEEEHPDLETLSTAGTRALTLLKEVGFGVVGNAAYAGLSALWQSAFK